MIILWELRISEFQENTSYFLEVDTARITEMGTMYIMIYEKLEQRDTFC